MATKKYCGYKNWTDYLYSVPSDPISNYGLSGYIFGICNESRKLMLPKEKLVKFHQRKLGKQLFTWNSHAGKKYIWEFNSCRLFVEEQEGRAIEVFTPSTTEIATNALNKYIKLLGITLPLKELHQNKYKFVE
jgi:hypothetical protein